MVYKCVTISSTKLSGLSWHPRVSGQCSRPCMYLCPPIYISLPVPGLYLDFLLSGRFFRTSSWCPCPPFCSAPGCIRFSGLSLFSSSLKALPKLYSNRLLPASLKNPLVFPACHTVLIA